jgi:pSer/pThr/pTyr-binding forkhead associated (FHA) protein
MSGFHIFDATNSIDHELPEGKTLVGRGADCDIRLLSSSVSRKHGLFEAAGGELTFSDLGSSNGSFVNGQPVKAAVSLRAGDELLMGDFRFTVTGDHRPAAAEAGDEDATQLASPGGEGEIPAMWSESAGLEKASGTQFFSEASESEAIAAYRAGKLDVPPPGNTPRLVGLSGGIKSEVFELRADGDHTWKIGREAGGVDLVIPDSSVSGQHAQLVNEGARWKIVNWMSTNGTFVNGHKGLSTYLRSGDVIRMGSAELAFELPAGAVEETKPAVEAGDAKKKSGGLMGLIRRLFTRV